MPALPSSRGAAHPCPLRAVSCARPTASRPGCRPPPWRGPRRWRSGRSQELLAQPDFQELVEAVREFQDLPEEERLRQLEQMAWCVLELALADSDWRAAAFIADQIARGRNPARTLARGVIKAQARATAPPTPAAESPTDPTSVPAI